MLVNRVSALRACALLATVSLPSLAHAQLVSTIPGVQTRISADPNGVDLVTGSFNYRQVDLGFGPKASTRLAVETTIGSGETDNYRGYVFEAVESGQSYLYAVRGNDTSKFLVSGSSFTSVAGDGATMVHAAGSPTYLMTERDGTQVSFQHQHYQSSGLYQGSHYIDFIEYIQFVDGERLTWSYRSNLSQWCTYDDEGGGFDAAKLSPARYRADTSKQKVEQSPAPAPTDEGGTVKGGGQTNRPPSNVHCYSHRWQRPQSITSSLGFQVRFSYAAETAPTDGSQGSGDFDRLTTATAVNLGVDYCDAAASTCAYSRAWPSLTYTAHSTGGQYATVAYTDPVGRPWSIESTYTNGTTQIAIRRPSSAVPYIVANLTNDKVTSVQTPNGTWQYSYSDDIANRTTRSADPSGVARFVVSELSTGIILSDQINIDGPPQQRFYGHDAYGRVTSAYLPEQNWEQYGYDTRGNITSIIKHAKPNSGTLDISVSSTYPTSCTSLVNCNKPTSSTDAKGNVTTFAWDPTHGGLLSVVSPAVNGIAPTTTYSYSALQAFYKDASGNPVPSGLPVYRLTQVSTCRTQASCAGGADESRTTLSYGPQTTGVANNLLPVSISQGSGDGALTATTMVGYDVDSNQVSVDGPLPGSGDTARASYDAIHRTVATMAPDPDGVGARRTPAQRYTYNADGLVTASERGTVPSQATDWSAFTANEVLQTAYDGADRKVTDTLVGGGAARSLTQYSYDGIGRLQCTAVRMNPSQWGGLPGDACTAQAAGADGPDRISRVDIYDDLGRVRQATSAYGTAQAATEEIAYTQNGQVLYVKDANGNQTAYIYDGHDRLSATQYPSPSSTGTSNAGDYEQLGYDLNSNVTSRRLRDGTSFSYTYDALNRMTLMHSPGGTNAGDLSYGYDNVAQLVSATKTPGHAVVFGYDALGRRKSEGSLAGSLSMQYDEAGRRTRLTWSDGFFVTYEYNQSGAMTAIRENGGFALAAFGYDDLGRRTSLTRGNGVTTSYGYDAASRLASLTQDIAGTAGDVTTTFSYNAAGQIGARTSSNDLYAWPGAVNVDRVYTTNGLNQYTQSGSVALGYDGRGNLTSSGSSSYQYTPSNQLWHVPYVTFMDYDALGRLYFNVNGSELYGYDGAALTTEVAYTGPWQPVPSADAGAITRRYVYGPGTDEALVWYEGAGTSDKRWLAADERGSVVAVTDASGNAIDIKSYDEYGIPNDTTPANAGRFGYTGQAWLPSLGMNYYKARMYSPTLGRFMQTDPVGYGDGLNHYNYVGGDPINFTDPSGLVAQSCATTTNQERVDGQLVDVVTVTGACGGGGGGGGSGFGGFLFPSPSYGGGFNFSPGGGGGGPAPGSVPEAAGEEVVVTATKPQNTQRPSRTQCGLTALNNNKLSLALDAGAAALTFLAPEASVAASIAGSVLGVIGIGNAVVNKDATGAGIAYAGKQAAVGGGFVAAGSNAARIVGRLNVGVLAASVLYDSAAVARDYNKCMAGQ